MLAAMTLIALTIGLALLLTIDPRWRRLLAVTYIAVVVMLPAGLASATADGTLETHAAETEVGLSPMLTQAILSVIIPILVGIVTKVNAPAKVKAVVSIVLNAVAALLTAAITEGGGAVLSQDTVLLWIMGTAISVASYLGFYQTVNLNQRAAPNTGIG